MLFVTLEIIPTIAYGYEIVTFQNRDEQFAISLLFCFYPIISSLLYYFLPNHLCPSRISSVTIDHFIIIQYEIDTQGNAIK